MAATAPAPEPPAVRVRRAAGIKSDLHDLTQRVLARYAAEVDERRARARESFRWFVEAAWSQVEPRRFIPGRHIDALCDFLQDYYDHGGGSDAVVNIPPGTGKSLICAVLWPAWIWVARNPGHRTICTSYADNTSRRDAIRCRNLVESSWWREAWPEIQVPYQNTHAAADWTTTTGGWRISAPLGGQITGRHGDAIIIDDPIKPEDARLERATLEEVQRVIDETLPTRLLQPAKAHRLIVMQRLHERDPAGVALDRGARKLVLPMHFDEKRRDPRDWRTSPGELLWPEGRPQEDVAALERAMTPYSRAGQLEQRPSPEGGGMFRREHVRLHSRPPNEREGGIWCVSCDATFTDARTSDYVAIGVWCLSGGKFYLAHLVREQMGFLATVAALRTVAASYPRAHAKLIEKAANGAAIVESLKQHGVLGVQAIPPLGGKEARAHVASAYWESGDILLPAAAPWVEDYVAEMCSFPGGRHDDQVDMTSLAVNWLSEKTAGGDRMRGFVRGVRTMA